MSLYYKILCTEVSQYIALLFYIMLLSEQQCVAGNIITNGTVYCLMNICSCFVMVLKLNIFSVVTQQEEVRYGYGMAGGYLTDVTLHSSRNNHQERARELRRLSKVVAVACGPEYYVSTEFPFCSSSNLW